MRKLIFLLLTLLFFTISFSPSLAETTDQKLKKLEGKVETIVYSNNAIKDYAKQSLTISSDTVKFVGTAISILLPFFCSHLAIKSTDPTNLKKKSETQGN